MEKKQLKDIIVFLIFSIVSICIIYLITTSLGICNFIVLKTSSVLYGNITIEMIMYFLLIFVFGYIYENNKIL